MIKTSRACILLLIAAYFISPHAVLAQVAPDQLDIIGLKLGMTVAQAKAVLQKYDPNLKVETLYTIDNEDPPHTGLLHEGYPPMKTAKIKIPNGLIGSLVTHGFGGGLTQRFTPDDKEVTDSKGVIYRVSGEFYWLEFTPTDDGGRLYAISRTVYLPAPGETTDELSKKFDDKYGNPNLQEPKHYWWIYDVRGRLVPKGSRDLTRCRSYFQSSDAQDMYKTVGFGGETLEAAKRTVFDFAPHFYKVDYSNPSYGQGFRQCGVQLESSLDTQTDKKQVIGFTTRLSDQNAAYFDTGVESYWQKMLTPAAKAASPKL